MVEDSNKQETPTRWNVSGDDGYEALITQESDTGKWVKWEDVEKLLETIRNQNEALQRAHAPKK